MNAVPRSQRNPVEAFPQVTHPALPAPANSCCQDLLFFFRVILFLRGLCTFLSARVKYMDAFIPYARMAMIRAVPAHLHATADISRTANQPTRSADSIRKHVLPVRSDLQASVEALIQRLYEEELFVGAQVLCCSARCAA